MTKEWRKLCARVCKKHGIELQLDANGYPTQQMITDFGLLFLRKQILIEAKRGRPKGSVGRPSRKDLVMITAAEGWVRETGLPFRKALRQVIRHAENKGLYPTPEHGGDPDAPVKRLLRQKDVMDKKRNALAQALDWKPDKK
jgi:hypothetical protein